MLFSSPLSTILHGIRADSLQENPFFCVWVSLLSLCNPLGVGFRLTGPSACCAPSPVFLFFLTWSISRLPSDGTSLYHCRTDSSSTALWFLLCSPASSLLRSSVSFLQLPRCSLHGAALLPCVQHWTPTSRPPASGVWLPVHNVAFLPPRPACPASCTALPSNGVSISCRSVPCVPLFQHGASVFYSFAPLFAAATFIFFGMKFC